MRVDAASHKNWMLSPCYEAKQLLQVFATAAPVTPLLQAAQLRLLRMLLLDPEHAQSQALLAHLQQ